MASWLSRVSVLRPWILSLVEILSIKFVSTERKIVLSDPSFVQLHFFFPWMRFLYNKKWQGNKHGETLKDQSESGGRPADKRLLAGAVNVTHGIFLNYSIDVITDLWQTSPPLIGVIYGFDYTTCFNIFIIIYRYDWKWGPCPYRYCRWHLTVVLAKRMRKYLSFSPTETVLHYTEVTIVAIDGLRRRPEQTYILSHPKACGHSSGRVCHHTDIRHLLLPASASKFRVVFISCFGFHLDSSLDATLQEGECVDYIIPLLFCFVALFCPRTYDRAHNNLLP